MREKNSAHHQATKNTLGVDPQKHDTMIYVKGKAC